MRAVILLNGEPHGGDIDASDAKVYCCDGAYMWAKDRVKIDFNIGDYDSLPFIPTPLPSRIYPSEKDFTDGEIALRQAIDDGADEVEFYGGGGGREDHFLGNLHLLRYCAQRGIKNALFTNRSKIFCFTGVFGLGEFCGRTASLLPFGESLHIMDFRGMKYAYPPVLGYGECRGISNVVLSKEAFIKVDGFALIIVNEGEV